MVAAGDFIVILRDPRLGKLAVQIEQTLPTKVATFPNLTRIYKIVPPGLPPMQSLGFEMESDSTVAGAIAAWIAHLSR